MALRQGSSLLRQMNELRIEPSSKWVRARLNGTVVADTTRPLLVWQPKHVSPGYAVPVDDLSVEFVETVSTGVAPPDEAKLVPLNDNGDDAGPLVIESADFRQHTTDGEELTLTVGSKQLVGAGFRPSDPDLNGYVLLDFDAFEWTEEDQVIKGHPCDPFHRVDVRQSSRNIRIELEGTVLAESSRPKLIFETKLPSRYYLPREDVNFEFLESSSRTSICPYKGDASYFSVTLGDHTVDDMAWSYETPLSDAAELTNYISFFNERVDMTIDGAQTRRPSTAWSDPNWE